MLLSFGWKQATEVELRTAPQDGVLIVMTDETRPEKKEHEAEGEVSERGPAVESLPGQTPESHQSSKSDQQQPRRRGLLDIGREALASAARTATRVGKNPKALALFHQAGDKARRLSRQAIDSTDRAATRIRESSPRAKKLVSQVADQAGELGRKTKESTYRAATKVRESTPQARELVDKAADLGRKAKNSTGQVATRLWESAPRARILIGETLKSTGEAIAPSKKVTDQPDDFTASSESPEGSAPGHIAARAPTAHAMQGELVAPERAANVRERADRPGDPVPTRTATPAVQPVVSTVPGSPQTRRELDLYHLKLLSYFYYGTSVIWVLALIQGMPGRLFGSLGTGLWSLFAGTFETFLAGCLFSTLYSLIMPILLVLGGISLARHRRYILCVFVALLACLSLALSTILGIASLIVLFRPTVRCIFRETRPGRTTTLLPAAPVSAVESDTEGEENRPGSTGDRIS